MRPLLALLLAALLATSLAGCASNDPRSLDEPTPALTGQQFEGAADEGKPAGVARAHGAFDRQDGEVATGNDGVQQVPSFWARKTVTLANSFSGADRAEVLLDRDSGSIVVKPGGTDGYLIEVVLEGRGITEMDARDALDHLDVVHTDVMKPDGLHLETRSKREPFTSPLPLQGLEVNLGRYAWAQFTVYLPVEPSYALSAQTSSGDISVAGLRGSFLVGSSSGDMVLDSLNARHVQADSSSGDVRLAAVQADRAELGTSSGDIVGSDLRVGKLAVDTSSGHVELDGIVDTLEAESSSGDLVADVHGRVSGAYRMASSSGDLVLRLLAADGRAYRVTADTASGDIHVDVPNSRTTDNGDDDRPADHVEAESRDYDEARLRTVVRLETSSGDITVDA